MQSKTKVCPQCKKRKELSAFGTRKNQWSTGKTYVITFCKLCMVARMKEWREKNREKYNDYQRKYHKGLVARK